MMADTLYFAQHGIAVDKNQDAKRPLSSDGVNQTAVVANLLLDLELNVSTIFHSNKLRARQTADIFASLLNPDNITELKNIAPNDDINLVKDTLTVNNALYIGHLPHLDKLVSSLVTGNENSSIIKFHNSAVLCLEKHEHRYQISHYLAPAKLAN